MGLDFNNKPSNITEFELDSEGDQGAQTHSLLLEKLWKQGCTYTKGKLLPTLFPSSPPIACILSNSFDKLSISKIMYTPWKAPNHTTILQLISLLICGRF